MAVYSIRGERIPEKYERTYTDIDEVTALARNLSLFYDAPVKVVCHHGFDSPSVLTSYNLRCGPVTMFTSLWGLLKHNLKARVPK